MTDIASRIIYEDNHLLIVNKLPGELSQGDKTNDRTIADDVRGYLRNVYEKPGNIYLGIPHRLDRPSSGVLVLAKTEKALVRMNELFRSEDAVAKTYWAVVDRLPDRPEGLVVHYLTRDAKKNKSTASLNERIGSREAKMRYVITGASKNYFLLEIELLTGRQHQIRAQLAAMGSHIKGDLKYGAPRSNENGGIHLHARSMSFIHPVKKQRLTVYAAPPDDPIWNYFASLAANGSISTYQLES
ncbi:MAG: RluA family pseudouridine synthase [Sphaerochaetaceae bacterium]|jgi:23S rRNA pseudouridine1911/1915/1917 synthase|nr:RluA family pseudouridine synthase [Sphaerochaetaceae bacterium]NLV84869.1 RluA family pseudouridine synthase [Spirochaetales bacterium]